MLSEWIGQLDLQSAIVKAHSCALLTVLCTLQLRQHRAMHGAPWLFFLVVVELHHCNHKLHLFLNVLSENHQLRYDFDSLPLFCPKTTTSPKSASTPILIPSTCAAEKACAYLLSLVPTLDAALRTS